MIFIGGIQPKTKIIDSQARLCPVCGLVRARYRRVDHYLSIFFIPVLKVKKGEPFLTCDACQRDVHEMIQAGEIGDELTGRICTGCGRELADDFRYCPGCGKRVDPRP